MINGKNIFWEIISTTGTPKKIIFIIDEDLKMPFAP